MNSYIDSVKALPGLDERSSALTTGFWIGGFALLTALSALVRIPLPFTPVPITMQTLVVLMAGVMLGGGRGALSQGVYVLAGIAGLPIFSSMASGLAWLGGPTGGYLVGFIVAPLVISMVLGDSGSYLRLLLGLTAGTLTILVFGTAWFAVLSDGGLLNAINLAFLPFVPGAIVKIGLASAITEGVRKAGKRR